MTISAKTRVILMGSVIIGLLLIPFIAMQFTEEVDWKIGDFLAAGLLLSVTALIIELVLRFIKSKTTKMLLVFTVLAALMLLWIELAVGIFDSPIAGN